NSDGLLLAAHRIRLQLVDVARALQTEDADIVDIVHRQIAMQGLAQSLGSIAGIGRDKCHTQAGTEQHLDLYRPRLSRQLAGDFRFGQLQYQAHPLCISHRQPQLPMAGPRDTVRRSRTFIGKPRPAQGNTTAQRGIGPGRVHGAHPQQGPLAGGDAIDDLCPLLRDPGTHHSMIDLDEAAPMLIAGPADACWQWTDHAYSAPMHRYLSSVYSSRPCREPSRPRPDSLTPPNGAIGLEISPSLMPMMPASSASATRHIRWISRL